MPFTFPTSHAWELVRLDLVFSQASGYDREFLLNIEGLRFLPIRPGKLIFLDTDEDPEEDEESDEEECDASSHEDPRTGASQAGAAPP